MSILSKHALNDCIFIASSIVKQKSQLNRFFAVFAVLIAVSRIYLGYHYLSDVVFGAFAGYFIGDIMANISKNENK